MQVKELVSFYINETSKTIDVSFRLETDGDEEIRNDSIMINDVESYGYEFLNENIEDLFEDEEDFFEKNYNEKYDNEFDETEVLSFLNEYYMINQNKLPPAELF